MFDVDFISYIIMTYSETSSYDPYIICDYEDIDIVYTNQLPNKVSGLASPEMRTIFMDDSLEDTNFKKFLLAHELYHVLYHEGVMTYHDSYNLNKNKLEFESNRGATTLLLLEYISNDEIPIEYLTLEHFMTSYSIPQELRSEVSLMATSLLLTFADATWHLKGTKSLELIQRLHRLRNITANPPRQIFYAQ
ncbi:ImmA/IrrE family metallo-endopeptidase [Enterococcus sp. 2201sp1_2201st1_B8_2201SCRN_220225]|uniref:ImmA/IrrE family metallo-endopeptidase n=1 Tax=unclassified Enterococcus TaxID=2608891 RepID=UPI0034A1BC5C